MEILRNKLLLWHIFAQAKPGSKASFLILVNFDNHSILTFKHNINWRTELVEPH